MFSPSMACEPRKMQTLSMAAGDQDRLIRLAAFTFLRDQVEQYGEVLPASPLREGFKFQGNRVPLQGPQGIFKPAVMHLPLSITTAPTITGRERPYEDELGPDGFLRYRYRGIDPVTAPRHRDNVGLRTAMTERVPLVYFHGIAKARYLAQWPTFIVGDDPGTLTFTVAVDDPLAVDVEPTGNLAEDATRLRHKARTAAASPTRLPPPGAPGLPRFLHDVSAAPPRTP